MAKKEIKVAGRHLLLGDRIRPAKKYTWRDYGEILESVELNRLTWIVKVKRIAASGSERIELVGIVLAENYFMEVDID